MAVTKSTDPIDILLEMGIDLDNLSEEEDYLSALMEAANTLTIKDATDPRIVPLQQEILKLRKKRFAKARPEAKKTTIKPDAFFNKKKPEEQAQPTPGQKALPGQQTAAIVKRSSLAPEEKKDNKDLKENNILKDILKTLNSILGTLKNQNKLSAKQAEKDRKAKEKKKRGAQEEKLESPIKKFLGAANKVIKPVKNFLDGLLEFFVKVFIGRLLFKLIEWGSENPEKVDAILGFFEKTWPAMLAVGLLFFTGLAGFVGKLIGLIVGFIPRLLALSGQVIKGVVGLAKFVVTNPILAPALAGAALFSAGAIIPKVMPETVDKQERKTEAAPGTNEEKIKALEEQKANLNPLERLQGVGAEIDEQIEFLKTGETKQYGKKFNKGGIVPGSGNTDSVRAMLTPGEFVMSKGAVQQYGLDTMKSMNAAGGGTNIPMVSGGITYAAGGGEIADPNEKVKPNDESKDRPKGDHSHELGHILGLDKIGGMVSGTEQPKKKGRNLLNMYQGYMDAVTFNMFDFDGMGKPSSMSASSKKEAPEQEGEKSGGGGSLKGLTGQDFRDLAYIVSGEAQRGTDDEYGVAAAVLNRVADPAWPNTVKAVGSQAGQFEAVYKGLAKDDPALAQKLASPEGQAKIVEALKMLKGRTDFKGTSQYGNMGPGDVKFSDRGNFYHYKEQVGKTDPPPSPIPTFYQKFIGSGGPAVTLNGTKSSASGISASPGSGGSSGGSGKTSGTSGPGGSTGRFQAPGPGGPGSVGSKTSYGDYLKNLYGKKKSADGITPLPSSTMSKGKSAGGPSADAGKNPGNQLPSPDNSIPAINAEAMHSDEKIEVLGIEIS